MQSSSIISVPSVGELIRGRIAELGISQTELAARVGEHFQTISAIINGKREATISLSVRIDEALDLPSGTIALAQTRYLVAKEINEKQTESMKETAYYFGEDQGQWWLLVLPGYSRKSGR